MNDAQIWGIVKDVGSLVGLLTGAFVLFDRLFRGRPYAAWLSMSSYSATLEFVNTSGRYIYLDRLICWPSNARASRFEDVKGTLEDHFNIERTIVLAPGGNCSTKITWSRNSPPKGWTLVITRWRRADALFALPIVKIAHWPWLLRFQERS